MYFVLRSVLTLQCDEIMMLLQKLKIVLITSVIFFRSKFRHMLQMSNLYRVQLILGKAKEQDMHAECAILYGKVIAFIIYQTKIQSPLAV